MKDVFFGETGPVPIPNAVTAAMPPLEVDAATSQDANDSRTPTSTGTGRRAKAQVPEAHHRVSVANMDDATWVVKLDEVILGYIHRAGTVYVALRGATLSLAVEVGQSVSRARAFTLLHSEWRVQAVSAQNAPRRSALFPLYSSISGRWRHRV